MKKPARRQSSSIGLINMGHASDTVLRVLAANIQTIFDVEADILSPMAIPDMAFEHRRGQYDAGLILNHLSRLPLPRHLRIVAITDLDLCSPILTYVFGQAQLGGKFAIVSDFRLKKSADGSCTPSALYYERIVKVALHEIGHTFSLYHCEAPGCLMQMSPETRDLDQLAIYLCNRCSFALHKNLKEVRDK
ncbi:MAG: archaemetzincin family Zn-dependent metalloprotease [Syntrophobacteraceae bacterium]